MNAPLHAIRQELVVRYVDVRGQIAAVIAGERDRTARYATTASILFQTFAPRFLWTGFYVVDPAKGDELVVGPYQGSLGCLRIPFGKGVCGTAAAERVTQIVPDVSAFSGHIACDARTRSEIVVPVLDANKRLAAVLDVDSEQLDAFTPEDKVGLEAICADLLTTS